MLSKTDLLIQDTIPNIKDISLKLYKNFSVDILLKQRFHYYFTDGTDIILEFHEWAVYHMLAIHHIDYNISKTDFFTKIDNGLDLSYFESNKAIKIRYREYKERISMFSCLYKTLKYGRVFYFYDRRVPNTANVKSDYIIYRQIDTKGLNVGIKFIEGHFTPFTLLISRAVKLDKYINGATPKMVAELHIIDIETNSILEDIIYTDKFITAV